MDKDSLFYDKNKRFLDRNINKYRTEISTFHNGNIEAEQELTENLNIVLESIVDKKQKNFHCIVSGNCEKEKEIVIDKLVNVLKKEEKIIAVRRVPIQNFFSLNTRDKNEMSFYAYTKLEPKMLYVIDGIGDFLEDCKYYSKNQQTDISKRMINTAISLLTDMVNENYIIIDTTLSEMEAFLNLDARLKFVYQNYIIKLLEVTLDKMYEIYQNTLIPELGDKLNQNNELYKNKFIQYVSLNQKSTPFNNREFAKYLAQYANSKRQLVFPNDEKQSSVVEKAIEEISGLQKIKDKLKEIENYIIFRLKAEANHINIGTTNMHMIFTGNAGTGKTTVAKIITEMFHDFGLIEENKLIEVDGYELIGKSVSKIEEIIQSALGGVLYIDEAYLLKERLIQDNTEAIATLLKAMETYKDELFVIFSGYKNEMKNFINTNPDIISKVGFIFEFDNYTSEELTEIFQRKVEKTGMKLQEEAKQKVLEIMQYFIDIENFENGKFVDKIFEQTIINHANYFVNDFEIGNITITEQDIPTIEQIIEKVFYYNSSYIESTLAKREALKRNVVHEVGHMVIRNLLFKTPGIKNITIKEEENKTAKLYVLYTELTDSYALSKLELMNKIKTNLGGIGAEELYFGDFESSNGDDLEKATQTAQKMILKLGMSDLGFAQILNRNGAMEEIINHETNKILKNCYDDIMMLLRKNKTKMDKVVEFLIEEKEMKEADFINTFKDTSMNGFTF